MEAQCLYRLGRLDEAGAKYGRMLAAGWEGDPEVMANAVAAGDRTAGEKAPSHDDDFDLDYNLGTAMLEAGDVEGGRRRLRKADRKARAILTESEYAVEAGAIAAQLAVAEQLAGDAGAAEDKYKELGRGRAAKSDAALKLVAVNNAMSCAPLPGDRDGIEAKLEELRAGERRRGSASRREGVRMSVAGVRFAC